MITEEEIQAQIAQLRAEQAALQNLHNELLLAFQKEQAEFQQKSMNNQNRFQQIQGAIAQLSGLLNNHEAPPSPSG